MVLKYILLCGFEVYPFEVDIREWDLHNTQFYAPVKLFCIQPTPPPLGTLGDITFLGGVPVSLSLYFCLAPPYINTIITLFSGAPPSFITHSSPLAPGLPRGIGEEQFDRRITMS